MEICPLDSESEIWVVLDDSGEPIASTKNEKVAKMILAALEKEKMS